MVCFVHIYHRLRHPLVLIGATASVLLGTLFWLTWNISQQDPNGFKSGLTAPPIWWWLLCRINSWISRSIWPNLPARRIQTSPKRLVLTRVKLVRSINCRRAVCCFNCFSIVPERLTVQVTTNSCFGPTMLQILSASEFGKRTTTGMSLTFTIMVSVRRSTVVQSLSA